MKAISIMQPFAYLIVHGHQPVENRAWRTSYRGRLLIHASKTFASIDDSQFYDFGFDREFIDMLRSNAIPRGALVGEVDLVDCVDDSDSPWYKGPYGLELENPLAYDKPIPYKGELDLFDVDLLSFEGGKVD